MRFLNPRWSVLAAALLMMGSPLARAAWELNMTEGVTAVSREIFGLHMLIFWICVVIGIVVFSVMFWSIFAHRKSQGAKASQFHESTTVEIIWTVVPFVILIAMAVPSTGALVRIYDTGDADIDIKVNGYQWKWQYEYLGEGVSFFSNLSTPKEEIYNEIEKNENYLLEVDEPLVIPVDKKVRFLVTANDVIHSWWVPELAVKRDAIPGFINEAWTKAEQIGTYRGQCAELCGKDHGFMPIVVEVKSQEDYDAWLLARKEQAAEEAELKNKTWTMAELMERGEQVYAKNCAACHQANGGGIAGAFPSLRGTDMMLKDRAGHIDVIINGRPGTMMAAYGPQLSEVDIAAVVTYERNAWGNDTGDVVTPMDIVKIKEGE